jgi:cytochrome b561
MLRNDVDTWGAPAKLLHWAMAALILAQVALGIMAVNWRLSPAKLQLFFWHKSTGVLVLALLALRLAWRLANHAPALPEGLPGWERAAARASHALLYLLMAALPITGWVVNAAANIPLRIFGLMPLPAIVVPDEDLADFAASLHRGLFVVLALVLVAHVGAALRHHFVRRNTVLTRMLLGPWGRR